MIDGSQPTVFLDCGLTLLESSEPQYVTNQEGWTLVQPWDPQQGIPMLVRPRPSSRPFLEGLHARKYNLCVLTGGCFHDQANLLRACGYLDIIRRVHGANSSGAPQNTAQWVLVDDDGEPTTKLDWLGLNKKRLGAGWNGVLERHVIQCSSCYGGNDSEPLTSLLDVIAQKLARQTI